jgi:hypothetical protein
MVWISEMYTSLNTTDRLVLRLRFITFIYVAETQRDVTAIDYEIGLIQFYSVSNSVTKNVSNKGRHETSNESILKHRLMVKALVTLINPFLKILYKYDG